MHIQNYLKTPQFLVFNFTKTFATESVLSYKCFVSFKNKTEEKNWKGTNHEHVNKFHSIYLKFLKITNSQQQCGFVDELVYKTREYLWVTETILNSKFVSSHGKGSCPLQSLPSSLWACSSRGNSIHVWELLRWFSLTDVAWA